MKNWLRRLFGITELKNEVLVHNKELLQGQDTVMHDQKNTNNVLKKITQDIYKNKNKVDLTNKLVNDLYRQIGFLVNKDLEKVEKISANKSKETISRFVIQNGENSINFELADVEEFNQNLQKIYMSTEQQNMFKNTLSSLGSAGANIGLAAYATRGLFKATADPANLMPLASGGLGAAVMDNGKIVRHAGFIPASPSIFTPLIVFQIASIITGVYYMNGINKQLQNVQDKLDELIKLFHIERQAKLIKSFKFINEYIQRKSFSIEDYVNIKAIIFEIANVREEYFLMVEDSYLKIKSDLNYEATFSNLSEAKKINKEFENSNIIFKLKNSLIADELYHLAKITEFHMNLCYKEPDLNRIGVIKEQLGEMKNFKTEEICFQKTLKLYDEIRNDTLKYFKKSLKGSIMNENKIKVIISDFKKKLNEFEKEKKSKINSISENYGKMVQPLTQQRTFYIDNRSGQPELLFLK